MTQLIHYGILMLCCFSSFSRGIARTMYSMSTSSRHLLLRRQYSSPAWRATAQNRKHHTVHSVQYKRTDSTSHCRTLQNPRKISSIPPASQSPDEEGPGQNICGCVTSVHNIIRNNIPRDNECCHRRSISDSVLTNCCSSSQYVCLNHASDILGDDPQYHHVLKQYNTRVSIIINYFLLLFSLHFFHMT